MTGPRQVEQGALFYKFSIDAHIPRDHLLRSIDRFVDLSELRRDLAPFYSSMGRPSIDPELMIRMLIIGYCFGIRFLQRCMREGLVGGEGFAVDAGLIKADANRQKGIEGEKGLPLEATGRAAQEYLAGLDDPAFGAAIEVSPKFISPADPAVRWTGAHGGQAFFAYSTNYLIGAWEGVNAGPLRQRFRSGRTEATR